jgi:uncharacterized membrane protein
MKNLQTHLAVLLLSTLGLLTGAYGQTAAASSTESVPNSSLQKKLGQTPALQTPASSRRRAPFVERQSGLPHISPKPAIQDSSPQFTYTWGLIDFPRSTSSAANGINDKGEIVGGYNNVSLELYNLSDHTFRLKGNAFSSINFPGAASTEAFGINKSGEIIGAFVDSSGITHGFLLVGSSYTQLDCPGLGGPGTSTLPSAINNSGDIVGDCQYNNDSYVATGFLLSGGVYSIITMPGAQYTWAGGINDAGVIVGWYQLDGGYQGFVDDAGSFTTINYPGYVGNTYLNGINDSGLILGGYGTPVTINSVYYEWPQGFLYSAGTFSTIDAPFGDVEVTNPMAINNKGEIVGGYVDGEGMTYGFYLKVAQ